jgi:hypothetical protein
MVPVRAVLSISGATPMLPIVCPTSTYIICISARSSASDGEEDSPCCRPGWAAMHHDRCCLRLMRPNDLAMA